jgi:hypothetical protein
MARGASELGVNLGFHRACGLGQYRDQRRGRWANLVRALELNGVTVRKSDLDGLPLRIEIEPALEPTTFCTASSTRNADSQRGCGFVVGANAIGLHPFTVLVKKAELLGAACTANASLRWIFVLTCRSDSPRRASAAGSFRGFPATPDPRLISPERCCWPSR